VARLGAVFPCHALMFDVSAIAPSALCAIRSTACIEQEAQSSDADSAALIESPYSLQGETDPLCIERSPPEKRKGPCRPREDLKIPARLTRVDLVQRLHRRQLLGARARTKNPLRVNRYS
jgi:hypothetical protein